MEELLATREEHVPAKLARGMTGNAINGRQQHRGAEECHTRCQRRKMKVDVDALTNSSHSYFHFYKADVTFKITIELKFNSDLLKFLMGSSIGCVSHFIKQKSLFWIFFSLIFLICTCKKNRKKKKEVVYLKVYNITLQLLYLFFVRHTSLTPSREETIPFHNKNLVLLHLNICHLTYLSSNITYNTIKHNNIKF
jgi:hypothetical protein